MDEQFETFLEKLINTLDKHEKVALIRAYKGKMSFESFKQFVPEHVNFISAEECFSCMNTHSSRSLLHVLDSYADNTIGPLTQKILSNILCKNYYSTELTFDFFAKVLSIEWKDIIAEDLIWRILSVTFRKFSKEEITNIISLLLLRNCKPDVIFYNFCSIDRNAELCCKDIIEILELNGADTSFTHDKQFLERILRNCNSVGLSNLVEVCDVDFLAISTLRELYMSSCMWEILASCIEKGADISALYLTHKDKIHDNKC
jgi:hypothetical protein